MARNDSARISPTAHYTGFVWYRNGMSHPAFRTRRGWMLFQALRPLTGAYVRTGGPSLEQMLLARHKVIDRLLEDAIEAGRVGQVLEVAAGLSPRGVGFAERHPELTYVEADLPGMVARKRRVLDRAGLGPPNLQLVEVDALADGGPLSLEAVAGSRLRPGVGTAIVTEGLLGYFPGDVVDALWRRFARLLHGYPSGLYLSDLHLGESARLPGVRLFRQLLSLFARGRVHLHFDGAEEVCRALAGAGFDGAEARDAGRLSVELGIPGLERVRVVAVLAARTGAEYTAPS